MLTKLDLMDKGTNALDVSVFTFSKKFVLDWLKVTAYINLLFGKIASTNILGIVPNIVP